MNRRSNSEHLSDYTVSIRVVPISGAAVVIGIISSLLAWLLLRLIGLFTNLFYFHRVNTSLINTSMVSPAGNHLGWLAVFVPVIGGLIVGVMARYGSDRIRGHGIPEAIESILMNGSRVQPKLAVLKPLSAAIAIGSGGPFGAEGPIIMTGGAVGSIIAQFFELTSAERKTLLVAGASAGMAAVFAAPISAVLLAVELMLFEFKPRSIVPVALASITAAWARVFLLGSGPLFPGAAHGANFSATTLLLCAVCGLLAGVLAMLLSKSIYAVEDGFSKLPIHWMWWPALGGIAVGVGGLMFPRSLGIGYDVIADLVSGHASLYLCAGILVFKSFVWIASLGSGTSGGVLAPILMIGGALGGLEAVVFPHQGLGFWPTISMGAVLAGTLEAPFTAIVFAVELTRDFNLALPLAAACFIAYAFMTLVMKRSILTEKIARRGFHLSREYEVDPLESFLVREAMRTDIQALPETARIGDARRLLARSKKSRQFVYPVVDACRHVVGTVTRVRLAGTEDGQAPLIQIARRKPVTASPGETLRSVVHRMVRSGLTRLPVVDTDGALLGMVALRDLLSARVRSLGEERDRARPLRFWPTRPAKTVADLGGDHLLPGT